ncbi:MAG: esterase-like activity of phytase family protein [Bacteroidales bacterium]|nr:esterase-like activity of phytase family protein [Bacteroidales bacterium]
MGGYTSISTSGIQGFSGLCLAPDGSGFIAASDRGGVYRVSFSGEATPLYVETDGYGLDCEGVTLDPGTGDIYFVLERDKQQVRRIRAPGYAESEILTTITEEVSYNSGLEAITWLGDGTLIVGNQANPCLLLRISATDGSIVSRTEITTGITDISDLCYDPVRDALWIPDSEAKTINLCDLEGKVLKRYSMSFIDNGEGLCVDRERQCVWVSDDTTSNIYKISFSNL